MVKKAIKLMEKIGNTMLPAELREDVMSKREEERVRVKVLRCFQNYEKGSVIDLPKSRLDHLLQRKMVECYAAPKKLDRVEPEANRSVGLERSEKKTEKRVR